MRVNGLALFSFSDRKVSQDPTDNPLKVLPDHLEMRADRAEKVVQEEL